MLAPHIVSRPGIRGGRPTLDTIAITVDLIAVWHEQTGMSVEEIAEEYELTLAQVHAALAYYYDHREEIDRRIAEEEAVHEAWVKQHPSLLRARLNRV